jgi:5-methylthioribose kinase
MNQRKTFDGEEAMRRLLRHAYKLEVNTINAEEIQTQYHKQAVNDLRTLAEDINVIAEQFADAYGADITFDFDIDIDELAEVNNEP